MAEGRKLPDKAPVLEAAFEKAWLDVSAAAPGPMFAAGKSMGGRMASMVASRQAFTPAPAGLIFVGYPLHPPNKPDKRRDAHLAAIVTPMLFVHGTRDPFGTPDEMKALVDALPTATLNLVDRGDHSLIARRGQPLSDQVLDQVVAWINAQ
jgi:predicted alpha/beta-hydrolase family hydrolase